MAPDPFPGVQHMVEIIGSPDGQVLDRRLYLQYWIELMTSNPKVKDVLLQVRINWNSFGLKEDEQKRSRMICLGKHRGAVLC